MCQLNLIYLLIKNFYVNSLNKITVIKYCVLFTAKFKQLDNFYTV